MDKNVIGLLITLILGVLLIAGWITGHNGILTGSVLAIIGLISGSIFGFKYAQIKK